MRHYLILIFCIFLATAHCGGPAYISAAESVAEPVQIEADRMESNQAKNEVHFSGHVEAVQGDIIIRANEMTVLYGDKKNNDSSQQSEPSRKIRNILANGNVTIIKEGWTATGDTMDFSARERKVVLTGNAKALQDKNVISGDSITLYLDEGKNVVEKNQGEGQRVKAVIYPESANTKDNSN